MTDPSDDRREARARNTHRGRIAVVIIFWALSGNALATVISQYGANPREVFLTITFVTLPYTGALVLVFLFMTLSEANPYTTLVLASVILLICFGLGAYLHLGISDAESGQVLQQINEVDDVPYGAPHKWPHQVAGGVIAIIVAFYYNKYGLALFVAATLAAIVITWSIATWWHDRRAAT